MSKIIDVVLHMEFDYSEDVNPNNEEGWWHLASFNSRHTCFRDPLDFFDGSRDGGPCPNGEWAGKFDEGKAYVVSRYDHSQVSWGLPSEVHQCQWDTASVAGVVYWSGEDKEFQVDEEQRLEQVRGFLNSFTDWSNGACFWFDLRGCGRKSDLPIEDNPSCGGIIGDKWMKECVKEELKDQYRVVRMSGEAAQCFEISDFDWGWPPVVEGEDEDEEEPEIMDETEQREVVVCGQRSYEIPQDVAGELKSLRKTMANLVGVLDDEMAVLTIYAANPDFSGPGQAVEIMATWTGNVTVRFSGETIGECLENVVQSMQDVGQKGDDHGTS